MTRAPSAKKPKDAELDDQDLDQVAGGQVRRSDMTIPKKTDKSSP